MPSPPPQEPSLLGWLPPAAAALAAVGVGLHTWKLPMLGPRELTMILCAAAWLGTAAVIAAGPGRDRLAGRLAALHPAVLALSLGSSVALLGAAAAGYVNFNLPIVVLLAAHCWLAASNVRIFPLAAAFVGVLTWALLYGSLALLGSFPAFSKIGLLRPLTLRAYEADYRVIQLESDCAEYDPDLFYRLRPGTCVFENVEFSTEYRINSLGVRDDEESLNAPRLVALGDSYTMGWGVEQDETFVARIEQQTGERILNAGVSSYGTVRELLLFERIDRSALETVILQYCANDDYENRAYIDNSNKLPVDTPDAYRRQVAYQRSTQRFHPLRLPYKLYETLWAEPLVTGLHHLGWPPPWTAEKLIIPRGEAAANFLTVLDNSPADLSSVRIVLFALGWGVARPSPFLVELDRLLKQLPPDDWRTRIEIMDVLPQMSLDDMLPIDRHVNAHGHQRLAEMLAPSLR